MKKTRDRGNRYTERVNALKSQPRIPLGDETALREALALLVERGIPVSQAALSIVESGGGDWHQFMRLFTWAQRTYPRQKARDEARSKVSEAAERIAEAALKTS